jgi:hypothetical protein
MKAACTRRPHCGRDGSVLYLTQSIAPRQATAAARGVNDVVNLIANVIGALGSIVFVGFLAYRIGAPPLGIIVVGTLALMVYSFYDDMRQDREKAAARAGRNGKTQ